MKRKYNYILNSAIRLSMSTPLSFNHHSMLLGKEHGLGFLKRMRKPKRVAFINPNNAEQNPIYRIMRNQRQLSPLQGLRSQPELGIKNIEKGSGPRQYFLDHSQLTENSYNKSQSAKQIESFKQKAVRIVAGTKRFTAELENSKRKIRILDRFNKKVEKYCSYLPETPEEEHNESQQANDQLIRLCRHNFFPTEDLHKRAHSLLHYQEPLISTVKMQRLKDRAKGISLSREDEGKDKPKPIKRFLTLNV